MQTSDPPVGGAVRRGLIAALVVLTVFAAVGFGLYVIWRAAQSHSIAEECRAGNYSVAPDQASVASTMVGVVTSRNLPERAAVLALAAGLQESKLTNLAPGEGDRDSVGVLQQRPSQGWGTNAQLSDIHYATGKFLDALVEIPGWQTMPLADAIQKVQISIDGSFYARHEGQAQALSDALTGKSPAGITCSFPKPKTAASPAAVAAALAQDLPVTSPRAGSATVSVPGASWATAAWFVANAERFSIDSVDYAGRQWTRAHGWRDDKSAPSSAVVATLHT
jgi:hypothetical protein